MILCLDFAGREALPWTSHLSWPHTTTPWITQPVMDPGLRLRYRYFTLVEADRETKTFIYHERTPEQYRQRVLYCAISWRQGSWPSPVLPLPL